MPIKKVKFPKSNIIIPAIMVTFISVAIVIGVIVHNNSQNREAKFESKQIYSEYTQINKEALNIEEKYATDGFIQPEDISTVLDELEILAKEYKSKGLISSYDKQSTSIYFKLNSGIGYLYTPTVEELLAGDDIGKILTIEPYATSSDFVSNYLIGGKSPDKAAERIVAELPERPRRPYERGVFADGGCIQPVGACYDTGACAVWNGQCQSKGAANRAAANYQGRNPRHLLPPLSGL